MGVRTYNLDKNPIVRGGTWKFTVNYLQPDGSTPMNLEGCTAKMRIRRSGDDEVSWDGSIDTETGAISLDLAAADTAKLNFSRAVYFVDVVFPSETRPILTGAIETR